MSQKRRFINQLVAGEVVDDIFLVRDKDLRTTKKGDLYITCTLCDRTGQLPARMWQATESTFEHIPNDGFLHVQGRCEDYRGMLQFVIDACRPYPAEKVNLSDFLRMTENDVEEMWAELLEILRSIKDEYINLLIKKFISEKQFVAAFKKVPAGLQVHHPFIGGLLEHTLNVVRAAKAILPLYPELNADLVLAGAFLHDVGKVAELMAGTSIRYTDYGQLVGHISIGVIMVAQKAEEVAREIGKPFPAKTLHLLEHIILSHHGTGEYGSPKLPAIPEAFLVHYLDNLDAKIFMATQAIEEDRNEAESFTTYQRQLETRIYKRSNQLLQSKSTDADEDKPLFDDSDSS
ncbi:MAG: HD domain-containing protein [Planctomycetes bacterium]|nr:HD domain-containing protein [Planctomycetota bacterium]